MKPVLLLTGGNGQLGQTFQQHWPDSKLAEDYELLAIDVDQLDLSDPTAVANYLVHKQPRLIINGAAYTAVDAAEEDQRAAFAVNEQAVANLASWCAGHQSSLILVSTDFVFDGKAETPYTPADTPAPLGAYGASKLAGEQQLQARLPEAGTIVRTSWLYSEYGANFVKTMLRLMGEREELGIVHDQIGSPTSTHSLVAFLYSLISVGTHTGIYHWTDGGSVSWYDFAVAIHEFGMEKGLLENTVELHPLGTAEYPKPARRPAYSVLDRSSSLAVPGCIESEWRIELEKVITALAGVRLSQQEASNE